MIESGGIAIVLICAIPVVAIICATVTRIFELKYGEKEERDELMHPVIKERMKFLRWLISHSVKFG